MKRSVLFALLLAAPLLPACRPGSDLVICQDGNTPTPGTPATIRDLQLRLGAPSQTFAYNPSQPTQFTAAKGTQVSIPANAFVQPNGQPVTGTVQLELREIYNKADMVLSNRPTVANGQLLVSAGAVLLRPTQDSLLQLAPGAQIQVQTRNPPSVSGRDSMRLFVAPFVRPGAPTCFSWLPNLDPGSSMQPTGAGYRLTISNALYNGGLRWLNVDRFYNTPPLLPIVADVVGNDVDPVGNTMVFAVFRNLNGVMRLCDFTAPGTFRLAGAPAGAAITLVVIRTVNGKLYYGSQTGTVAAGIRFSPSLAEATVPELVAFLNSL